MLSIDPILNPDKLSFPYIRQRNDYCCGEACLKMLLSFHKVNYQSNDIELSETFSLLSLSDQLRKYDIDNEALESDFEYVKYRFVTPSIFYLPVKHFVILYSIQKNSVFIMDPLMGHVTMSHVDFCHQWLSYDSNKPASGIWLSCGKLYN